VDLIIDRRKGTHSTLKEIARVRLADQLHLQRTLSSWLEEVERIVHRDFRRANPRDDPVKIQEAKRNAYKGADLPEPINATVDNRTRGWDLGCDLDAECRTGHTANVAEESRVLPHCSPAGVATDGEASIAEGT
jgi:hypothetical protein